MAKRGPYKQKADIPPPIGAQESIRLHWDIMINNPDRGERRAAKKLLRKMGVEQAANVDVDHKVPVMHPIKFKRKQTEAQRARSEAFFNRDMEVPQTPTVTPNSSVGSPQAAVEGTESNPEGDVAVQHINTSTAGKGYQGDWFNFPLPIPDASRPAPQPQGTLTIEQARAQGLPVKFAGDVGVWMYRKVHGALHWTACAGQSEPAPLTTGKFMAPLYDRAPVKASRQPCAPGTCRCTDRDCGR